ncbi:MAG: GerW family sporulation protein [Lachnospiraceae bacterium]|nr:GerW family sporulation protein [Lachnospiraceae bacterium]
MADNKVTERKNSENNITNVMDAMMSNMQHLVGSKTVIGDPVTVGDATIIPLVDVSFGLAAGAGSKANGASKSTGVGGMNAKMSPSAILILQGGHARLISVKDTGSISKIADLVPELIDKFKARKNVNVDVDEAKEAAFPEGESTPTNA